VLVRDGVAEEVMAGDDEMELALPFRA